MSEIIDHNHPKYREKWSKMTSNQFNGAFYYSKEIVKNIIPNVKTDRPWVTINVPGECRDHAIVFIHNNKHPENYCWLANYKDLILVCGIEKTAHFVSQYHRAIVLPLSVDVADVEQYKRPQDKEMAYVGRYSKQIGLKLPKGCDKIFNMPRTKLLYEMSRYKKVYAVGRCAIEAKVLGAEIGYYDPRYPDPSIWQVLDNRDAAKMLQAKIDEIDNVQ